LSDLRIDDRAVMTRDFDTDFITDAGMSDHRDFSGPHATHHAEPGKRGRALYARYAPGGGARMLIVANRLVSSKAHHRVTRLAMGIPRPGALNSASSKES